MLDLNNLPKQKFEDICKYIDFVLVGLLAVFFILSLFPYYSVQEGEIISSRGYGDGTKHEVIVEASEDDAWSLLGYVGFPYNHLSVEEWQEKLFKENKSIIKENEKNDYDGFFRETAGKLGMTLANEDGEKNPYVDLEIPGITTKTVSIKQVGAILFLDIFAIVGIILLLLKKGVVRAVICTIWGIVGVLGFQFNYLLNMGTTWVKPTMSILALIVLVVALVDTVLYFIDNTKRAAYLRSVSAAYA